MRRNENSEAMWRAGRLAVRHPSANGEAAKSIAARANALADGNRHGEVPQRNEVADYLAMALAGAIFGAEIDRKAERLRAVREARKAA